MKLTLRCRKTLAERACIHNFSTYEATESFPSWVIPGLIDFTSGLKPFGRPLDPDRTGEVVMDALIASAKLSGLASDSATLSRLYGLTWTIACRTQAREERHRTKHVLGTDLDQFTAPTGLTEFEKVETKVVLETAAANLEESGIRRERFKSVILSLFGWKVGDIAEASGEHVEAVRKRIQRSRTEVVAELRRQFTEVA